MKRMRLAEKILMIVTISIASVFILGIIGYIVLACLINNSYSYSAKQYIEQSQKEIAFRVDSFVNVRGRLPETLSEVGFGQNVFAYCFDNIEHTTTFYIIPTDTVGNIYMLYLRCNSAVSYYDSKSKEWHYVREKRVSPPPRYSDTLEIISDIIYDGNLNSKKKMIESQPNTESIKPLNSYSCIEYDSVGWVEYRYPDGRECMVGMIAFSGDWKYSDGRYGEWSYYDEAGHCYRKFWNYKMNGIIRYGKNERLALPK